MLYVFIKNPFFKKVYQEKQKGIFIDFYQYF